MTRDRINNEAQLEDLLSEPYPEDVAWAGRVVGDVAVLGAGGKMGPTLAARAARAFKAAGRSNKVYAVSRFSDPAPRAKMEAWGAIAIAADLLDEDDAARRMACLADCPNIVYMAGMKFGTTGREHQTWAMNTYLPGRLAERFKSSRIAAFSTGNVYPLVAVASGGAKESDPTGPVGEYAQSCLGRERVLGYFSERNQTPMSILRLNYAVEPRYGVLLDIATRVYSGAAVDVSMGYVNVIWQGDANSFALRSLDLCKSPPEILNITGAEIWPVRRLAERFGEQFGRRPLIEGQESRTALLNNAQHSHRLLGAPRTSIEDVIAWVAHWVRIGGPTLNKPTKFETRDGRF